MSTSSRSRQNSIRVLTPAHSDWPVRVYEASPAPAELAIAGHLGDLTRPVAIVGTRSADREALEFTVRIARELARAGISVISGGARGVDAAAHRGALAGGGLTIAVLPTGLEAPYPPAHESLFRAIASHGALLSEVVHSVPPHPGRFIRRNRLIAALALVVVVVQAPFRSGALHTARFALEMDRTLLAVPHSPWDVRGMGAVDLLTRGAWLCTGVESVFAALERPPGQAGPDCIATLRQPQSGSATSGKAQPELRQLAFSRAFPQPSAVAPTSSARIGDPVLERVRNALTHVPLHVDEVVEVTGLEPQLTHRALVRLTLLGAARAEGEGYVRVTSSDR